MPSSMLTKGKPRVVLGGRKHTMCVRAEKNWAKEAGSVSVTEKMLPTERYIAMNRFKVKPGAVAKFEQRWTTRKSRLAELDGFRYFTLCRRVPRVPGDDIPADEPNYVSFTIWKAQEDFQAWYTGDAFKEAHGGGSLFGFVDMLVNATFTLNGAPKPAFWHGMLPIGTPGDMSGMDVAAGWRVVEADGKNILDAEVFIAMNRFKIAEGREEDFEARWAGRDSNLKEMDGFKAFVMCRRDGLKADDGYNYQSVTVWRDRAAFDNWTASKSFSKSHSNTDMTMFNGPPSPAFYEGVLTLESAAGA